VEGRTKARARKEWKGGRAVDVPEIHGPVRTVTFWCRLAGPGSIEAGILDGVSHTFPTASTISDGMGDLLRAGITLLEGAEKATCSWEEEPGEYEWVFERNGEELDLRILWFEDQFERKPEDPGEPRFSTHCMLMRVASQVRDQFQKLLDDAGPERYQREWGFAFPMAEFDRLNALTMDSG
jgi:hypothetical protein